ncbi:MAG: HDOD domain-containing protein [Hydrogenophaga sp.]|nr:HDOD domain-containing protein [Hydrogenophaga sp.]
MVLMLWIAGVLVIALVWWLLRRSPAARTAGGPALPSRGVPPPPGTPHSQRMPAAPMPAAPPASLTPPVPVERPVPPELVALHWTREAELDGERRLALAHAVKGIPRPPRSLQKLLSPEFLARAGSNELGELVMGEPLIAAKVLSTVNSPLYGLRNPVNGIGQAITFLGMNTVRSICMQYMLAEAFKPTLASSQRAFDRIWHASAIASELSVRLGKALNLPEQGALATQVVLGFVGHLAAASLLPPASLDSWLAMDRVQRTRHEQDAVGLSAGEIGGLLLKLWELPGGLVDDVCDTSRVLVEPSTTVGYGRVPRLALCYLCAHLGERLALGQMASLEGYDTSQDHTPATFHLQGYLAHPALAQLNAALQSAEVQSAVQNLLSGGRQPA